MSGLRLALRRPFPVPEGFPLPLAGERHPLNRSRPRLLFWGNAVALAVGIVVFMAWLLWTRSRPAEPTTRPVKIVRFTELGVPPSIARTQAPPALNIVQSVAPPSIGVPEPVPDEVAPRQTIATVTEMSEAVAPVSMSDLGLGAGDSIVVDLDIPPGGRPGPEEFVAVEEEPVRVSIDAPVFPQVALDAGVEGTVIVRALVGKDGKVIDCVVIEGHQLLREAAIACARTAVFRPALLQKQPVEVWVMMPITFKLRR
jgi:protein TonB